MAADAARRFRCQTHNQLLFPEFCAGDEKWFRRVGNCFVAGLVNATIIQKHQ